MACRISKRFYRIAGDNPVVKFTGDRRLPCKLGDVNKRIGKHIFGFFGHVVRRSGESPMQEIPMPPDSHRIQRFGGHAPGNEFRLRRILETAGAADHANPHPGL